MTNMKSLYIAAVALLSAHAVVAQNDTTTTSSMASSMADSTTTTTTTSVYYTGSGGYNYYQNECKTSCSNVIGADCSNPNGTECGKPLECVNGKCAASCSNNQFRAENGACVAMYALGSACNRSYECLSDYCHYGPNASVCQVTEVTDPDDNDGLHNVPDGSSCNHTSDCLYGSKCSGTPSVCVPEFFSGKAGDDCEDYFECGIGLACVSGKCGSACAASTDTDDFTCTDTGFVKSCTIVVPSACTIGAFRNFILCADLVDSSSTPTVTQSCLNSFEAFYPCIKAELGVCGQNYLDYLKSNVASSSSSLQIPTIFVATVVLAFLARI